MPQHFLRFALPALGGILFALTARSQPIEARPTFEVASIKLNKECTGPKLGYDAFSPGSLTMPCVTLRTLVVLAYTAFEGPNPSSRRTQILGGPAWMNADFYSLAAKAEGPARRAEMEGPMLRSLLEERFQLKTHKESRDSAVYAMTVDSAKLQPLKEGGCLPYDTDHPLDMHAPNKPGDPRYCGAVMINTDGRTTTATFYGITMAELAGRMLPSLNVDRPIIDKTGLAGRYDIRLEFATRFSAGMALLNGAPADDLPQAPDDSAGPSIFTALQGQLGLKLTPDRGPVEVLVIDSVERPTAN